MLRKLGLMLAAALSPGSAHAAWQMASSPHFIVYSEDTPDHVKAFTVQLERYDKAMHVSRGLVDEPTGPSSRVTVFVVRNIDAVQRLAGRGEGDVAGFYIARAEGSVAFIPRSSGDGSRTALTAQQVLLHEYAHHVTFMTFGHAALPPWFVEGFAEFNATARFDPDGSVTLGAPPLYRAYNILNSSALPVTTLLTADPNVLPSEQRDTFYGRGWLLTHYLTFDADRRKQLAEYLTRINEGISATQAMAVFGDPAKLDAELNRYALRSRLANITLAAASLPIGQVTVRALTPAEAETMAALILSKRGVNAKTAPGVLTQAVAAAAAYPTDAFALNELAEAEYDAGQYDAARATAARATAADPRSVHALMYQGMAAMAIAVESKSRDPASWQAARGWFSRANRIDPDDAWPLAMFYRSYRAAGAATTANAQAGLIAAHALAPFDPALGVEAAEVYLRQGRPDEARIALKPVAFSPHGGSMTSLANITLVALETGGIRPALAILDGGMTQKSDAGGATDKPTEIAGRPFRRRR